MLVTPSRQGECLLRMPAVCFPSQADHVAASLWQQLLIDVSVRVVLAAQVVWAELAVAAAHVLSLPVFRFCQPRYKLVLADGQVLEATVPNLHKYMGGEVLDSVMLCGSCC